MIATVQFIVPVIVPDGPPISFIPSNNGIFTDTGWSLRLLNHNCSPLDPTHLYAVNYDRSPRLRFEVPLSNCIITYDDRRGD